VSAPRYYVLTRYRLPNWVAVETADTMVEARAKVEACKAQDDPIWAVAEYRIDTTRHPSKEAQANA
jgi:hypothetical protein